MLRFVLAVGVITVGAECMFPGLGRDDAENCLRLSRAAAEFAKKGSVSPGVLSSSDMPAFTEAGKVIQEGCVQNGVLSSGALYLLKSRVEKLLEFGKPDEARRLFEIFRPFDSAGKVVSHCSYLLRLYDHVCSRVVPVGGRASPFSMEKKMDRGGAAFSCVSPISSSSTVSVVSKSGEEGA